MVNFRTAVILCGGKGTRLGVLGKKKPKTLLKVQGKEIMWFIINVLKKNKFNHLILPLGYKGSYIKEFLRKNKKFNLKIDCIQTGINSNIGYRISKIKNKILSKNFLLLNGDAIFNVNIDKIFKEHEKKDKVVSFLSGEIVYPYGTIGIKKGIVKDFKRNLTYDAIKTRANNSYIAYNYTGMSIIKSKIIKQDRNYKNSKNFEKTFFPKLIRLNKSRLIKIKGFWHSIDNVKDLAAVNFKMRENNQYLKVKDIKKKFLKADK